MRILISHATEDQAAAAQLKQLIERCSAHRIQVWFSSDQTAQGGMTIGSAWFVDLHERLSNTDLIVALVTPNSANSPWLYFECGFKASQRQSSIIPLTLGLGISDLRMPLAAYQAFDLSHSKSLDAVVQKLFAAAQVPYDEELTAPLRDETNRRLLVLADDLRKPKEFALSAPSEISNLREYLDKRFFDFYSLLPPAQQPGMFLEISFQVMQHGAAIKEFPVRVQSSASVQDVLDQCYFQLDGLVKPFKYLISWIIEDNSSGEKIVLRGAHQVTDRVPASSIFNYGGTYVIRLLESPYSPLDDPISL